MKDTEWSVLIMDTTTTPVMSSVCRISEILDYGVSCKAPPSIERLSCMKAFTPCKHLEMDAPASCAPPPVSKAPRNIDRHPAVVATRTLLCRLGLQASSSFDGLLL